MNEGSGSRAGRTRRRRWLAGLAMAVFAAFAAVVSYSDGLFLVRLLGATGRVVYLYPLLADWLIVIATIALYDAARDGHPRPRWATAGVALGAVLTVAMNVAAGLAHGPGLALADGMVPVVFFVALEIFIGHVRRGRGGAFPDSLGGYAPAAPGHPEPPTTEAALAVLLATDSQRRLAAELGVPRSRVTAWAARVAPAADRYGESPGDSSAVTIALNGEAGHD